MKQLLQYMRDGQTVVSEVPVPEPQPGMALIRTGASLVSAGTERMLVDFAEKNLVDKARSRPDLVRQVMDKARREGILTTVEATFNRLDQPMALGYSSAGTIISVGEGLTDFKPGDRVACAGGGHAVHAEYVVVPQNLMVKLPDSVDYESAAFATLGAIAMQGFRLAGPQVGDRVAVIGLGLLGLLTVGIARAAGCRVLGVDLDPTRIALAQTYGAAAVVRGQAEEGARSFTQNSGFDAVIICADTHSNDPVELAGSIARDKGVVVAVGAVGLTIPRKIYYEKELQLIISRSYGPGRYDLDYEEKGRDYPIGYVRWTEGRNIEAVVDLIATGKLDVKPLISHRFPIEEAPEAYALITGKVHQPFLGVVLTYSQAEPAEPIHKVNLSPTPDLPGLNREPGLGVLGAGNYAGAVFLPVIQKVGGVKRIGIATAGGLTARHAAEKFRFSYAGTSDEELIRDEQVNAIAILTRHKDHARQTSAALRLNKSVYCEKPLALNLAELEEVQHALDEAHEALLMVGFNRRFAPFSVRLSQFLQNRTEPLWIHYRINAGFLPDNHWLHDAAQGGGRIIGEGCHFVDYLSFLVGAIPISVRTQGLPDSGRYHEDNVDLEFRFADGSLGTISYLANGDKAFSKERVEVFCGGRVAVLDDFRNLELIQNGKREVVRSRLKQDKGHRAAWEAFIQSVKDGGQPPIPYGHLFGASKACFAAVESLRSGKECQVA